MRLYVGDDRTQLIERTGIEAAALGQNVRSEARFLRCGDKLIRSGAALKCDQRHRDW
jgi:hypothetical protein